MNIRATHKPQPTNYVTENVEKENVEPKKKEVCLFLWVKLNCVDFKPKKIFN